MKAFSVVIPLYNKGDTIGRCLASVQSNDSALIEEIVVVNDGSTDCSERIVQEWSARDDRIKLIRQTNRGVSVARNAGIAASRCEYVLLLDADDEWKSDFASTIASLVQRCPDAVLFGTGFKFIWANGSESQPNLKHVPEAADGGYIEDFIRCLCAGDAPFYSSSVALRKKVVDEVGGFPAGVTHGEDKILWLRLAAHGAFAWSPRIACIRHECRGSNSAVTWTPERGKYYLHEIERRLAEHSDEGKLQDLHRLHVKEIGHFGRQAARTRHISVALKVVGQLLLRGRIDLVTQILVVLLLPSRMYHDTKVAWKRNLQRLVTALYLLT